MLKSNSLTGGDRVAYLDMLKCLGMFIVVSGHIHFHYGWFSLPLHCFVIPLYFLLSGMTFKRSKFPTLVDFIKHRAKTLLLPYFMFSIVTWAFWAVYNVATHTYVDLWSPLFQTIFAQGSGGYLVHNVPLWFLPPYLWLRCCII
jgi:fucose 4-O-acetylase-like acetyltransferase